MKTQFTDKCTKLLKDASDIFKIDLINTVISFDLKGKCAGRAITKTNARTTGIKTHQLMFNQEAIDLHWDDMFNNTIPHEIAHLVCHVRKELGKNHNNGWKHVCNVLGGAATIYHAYELTPGRVSKKHIYIAQCGTKVELSSIRHNKLQKGVVEYYQLASTGSRMYRNDCIGTVTPQIVPKLVTQKQKNGKVTNSSIVREMMEAHIAITGNIDAITDDEDFLQTVLLQCGQTRQLARAYIKDIVRKIKGA